MWLFVGLGNPGAKYAGNRHNIGFMAVDEIVRRHNFSPWRQKFQGEICEGTIDGEKVMVLKPMTFMNLSGDSVGPAMRFHKIPLDHVVVFHDELDVAAGKVKCKTGGGHAGHNGLRSLHQHLGAEFHRIRLGIGHPGEKHLVSPYVLGDFFKVEHEWLSPMLGAVARQAGWLVKGDFARYQTAVAQDLLPPKPEKLPNEPKKAPAEPPKAEPARDPHSGSMADRLAALFKKI